MTALQFGVFALGLVVIVAALEIYDLWMIGRERKRRAGK